MNINLTDVVTEQLQEFNLARSLIQSELNGIFGSATMKDLNEIIHLYNIYESGADFDIEGGGDGDYVPANHKFKIIRGLINKEARFLFAIPPTINIESTIEEEENKELISSQYLVKKVLETNHFSSKLVRAAKDYLIGKRIAIAANFSDRGIDLSFIPSLEFIYETDPTDVDVMTKFIQFYSVVVNNQKSQQRIYKKKWELKEGYCWITEELYDGNAKLIETLIPEQKTKFTYIPVWVIVNEGLTGDAFGTSDVEELMYDESWYSKLTSKDFDSLRKGTDQIVWAMDVNPRSTKNLSRSAGSFWDLSSDPASNEKTGAIGCLDNSMAYSPALDTSLNRIRASMYAQLDIPDTTSEALQGVISSGKTMEAMYWGLKVRCDEKMLDWIPAMTNMVNAIVEGAILYPNAKQVYTSESLTENFNVTVENNYPILKDTTEEKSTDLLEINAKVMSRKAYLKKWYDMTDKEIDDELKQIVYEQNLLEDENYKTAPDMMGE